jgi:hypothetical protein
VNCRLFAFLKYSDDITDLDLFFAWLDQASPRPPAASAAGREKAGSAGCVEHLTVVTLP